MKIVSAILFVFLSCAVSFAQDKRKSETDFRSILSGNNFQIVKDQCGDHLFASEGNIYPDSKGKIVKIVAGNSVIFEIVDDNGKKEKITIYLAGVESSNSAKSYLKKNLLNKNVRVKGWISNATGENRIAVIYDGVAMANEINCYMIKNGIAQYRKFEGNNIVPDFKNYYYAEAEKTAKEAKLGIWGK